jgi:hypothetical protein
MASLVKTLAKCTIALSVLCVAAFAQPKPKAAVYIMGNPEGRDAIRAAVNTFLIKSGKYRMIAVDAIDVVAQEQMRQLSGAVSDSDIAALGRDAGAQYVCVVERSELDGVSYVATRMVSVQSKVAELADIVELPYGGKIIDIIQWQIGSMLGMAVGPRPAGSSSGYTGSARPVYAASVQSAAAAPVSRTEPPIQGTIVPGGGLTQKLAWLQRSADSHSVYIVEVNTDERIAPYTFEYRGGINITVVLRGIGGNRTIMLQSNGTMFTVRENIIFVLDNNIILRGHSGNDGRMVEVSGGTFKMNNGAAITGNPGGGVHINQGAFEMTGGTISGNGNKDMGGGGIAISGGTFTMIGGTISGNIASQGGGVYRGDWSHGVFVMRGGTISSNTAMVCGGGVRISKVDFGEITTNFTKTGGIITSYKNDPTNGNVVKDEDGNILARKGHAIYFNNNKRKETTAGPDANFTKDGAGPWDQ